MDKIYYYKTEDGIWHFSTGVKKDDSRAVEYIRMLGKIKKDVRRLYLDIPSDYEKIKQVFGVSESTSWQKIYLQKND